MFDNLHKPLRGPREIYRIGMGPSSSHSTGPRWATEIFREGDGSHRVNFDEVIKTMRKTGHDMSADYRETSLAGLAALKK
jgi:hypothetical protein